MEVNKCPNCDQLRAELARRDAIYKSGTVVVPNDEYSKLNADLATLRAELKSSEEIRHEEKKILLDEIAKNAQLRAELADAKGSLELHYDADALCAQLLAEIERMHGEMYGYRETADALLKQTMEERNALRAENERLRTSLQRIIDGIPAFHEGSLFVEHYDMDGNYIGCEDVDPLSVIQSMEDCARRALEGK